MPTKDTVMRSITRCAGDDVECHARPRMWAVQVHDANIATDPDCVHLFTHLNDAVSYYEKIVGEYRETGAAELTEYGETLDPASDWVHGRTVFLNTDETETTFMITKMRINRGPLWGGRK